jgi:phenylacetate-coenzyme A ligase PaaK-like adenylate-forming protein
MNPFLNPKYFLPFAKQLIVDPSRLARLDPHQLNRYKDKQFRKIVTYSYKIPLYHKKFKEAHIHPYDIQGIKDIHHLPLINREDFSKYFPDGIIPSQKQPEDFYTICTGGTTTKYCCQSGTQPVCTFTNFPSLLRGSIVSSRSYRFFNIHWRKTRIAHIGNFNPYKFDQVYEDNILHPMKQFISLDNNLPLQASSHTTELIEKLENFNPEVIISYPSIYQDIAFQKRKGLGLSIKPRILFVGGAMLDAYTRRYVEDTFQCPMYNTYASCESGAEIAFECPQHNWHLHDDFFHLEAQDIDGNLVSPGERGRLIITRLWGDGTPIIRYTGMEDWITLNDGNTCSCGLHGPILGGPVEGRVRSNIILPDGRIFPPSAFLFITEVLETLNTFKVTRYQIIQKNLHEIDILMVVDNDQQNLPPSFQVLSNQVKHAYQKVTGPKVTINVIEVDEIADADSGKPAPLVVSYVKDACIHNSH